MTRLPFFCILCLSLKKKGEKFMACHHAVRINGEIFWDENEEYHANAVTVAINHFCKTQEEADAFVLKIDNDEIPIEFGYVYDDEKLEILTESRHHQRLKWYIEPRAKDAGNRNARKAKAAMKKAVEKEMATA